MQDVFVYSYDEFVALVEYVTENQASVANECGEWFFTVSNESDLDEKDIIKKISKELRIGDFEIIVDLYKGKVAIVF